MYVFNCLVCERQFTKERKDSKFCSQECYHIDRIKQGHYKTNLLEGSCKDCGLLILKSRTRCDDCHAKYQSRPVKPQKMNKRKNCSKCGIEKTSENTFSPKEGMWSPQCRRCLEAKGKRSRINIKQNAVDYKGGCCQVCGYKKCLAALDFHHLDPTQKEFTVARKKLNVDNEEMRLELDKCALLCANCHRQEHFNLKSGQPSLLTPPTNT